jgi:hypothetical protein
MRALIVTVCSNRKRSPPPPELRGRELRPGRIEDVAAEWRSRIAEARQLFPATQLYCGRAFAEAVACANVSCRPLYVVSAGLGLIEGTASIPSYSLSIIAGSQDNILTKLSSDERATQWWNHLTNHEDRNRFQEILSKHPNVLALAALPSAYLRMIAGDLLTLSDADRSRLRLFGCGGESVGEALRHFVMPYDARLDSSDSPIRGTRSDFAQRAMRHFVEFILAEDPKGSAQRHATHVEAALRMWTVPPFYCRTRVSDEEIVALIREHWTAAQGQSTRMLRVLRDDLGVACEQGRLSQLFRHVRSQMGFVQ